MSNRRTFFYYVIPSVLSFALSGIYAIVDGFFCGQFHRGCGSFYVLSERLLSALGAYGELLVLGKEYTTVIILGTVLQVFGTGMVPFMRNYGGAMWGYGRCKS